MTRTDLRLFHLVCCLGVLPERPLQRALEADRTVRSGNKGLIRLGPARLHDEEIRRRGCGTADALLQVEALKDNSGDIGSNLVGLFALVVDVHAEGGGIPEEGPVGDGAAKQVQEGHPIRRAAALDEDRLVGGDAEAAAAADLDLVRVDTLSHSELREQLVQDGESVGCRCREGQVGSGQC